MKETSFRGSQIPQFEADFLQELENQLGKQFKLVRKIYYNTQMGFLTVNNRITSINLFDCGISSLPESIGQLSSLYELKLFDNQLSTLPESIGKLTSLQELDLRDNKLTTLPVSMIYFTSFTKLSVSNNPLDSKAKSMLEQLNK